jgi:hypothetical protein
LCNLSKLSEKARRLDQPNGACQQAEPKLGGE